MHLPSAAELANILRARIVEQKFPLSAYWVRVEGDRQECEDELRRHLEGDPVVVISLRRQGFNDPNTVLQDLVGLLNEHQDACFAALSDPGARSVAIVLLARTSLNVPQSPSPVSLPEWFPIFGSQTVYTLLEDLTFADTSSLSSPDARIDDLANQLHALETTLIRRLGQVQTMDKVAADSLCGLWRRETDGPFTELLAAMSLRNSAVKDPGGFRPSRALAGSLVARLWALVGDRNPEESRASKALAKALAIPDALAPPRESLAAVVSRPSTQPDGGTRVARNILVTIYASCQLLTARAHADDYGRYPAQLLLSTSYDLRRTLRDIDISVAALVDGDNQEEF